MSRIPPFFSSSPWRSVVCLSNVSPGAQQYRDISSFSLSLSQLVTVSWCVMDRETFSIRWGRGRAWILAGWVP